MLKSIQKNLILFMVLFFNSSNAFSQPSSVICGHLLDVESGEYNKNVFIDFDPNTQIISSIDINTNKRPNPQTIDLSNYFCLPGLIDMHTHISEASSGDLIEFYTKTQQEQLKVGRVNVEKTLKAGFTTVRDLGVYIAWTDKKLRDEINADKIPGPRMKISGYYLSIPGGGGDVAVPDYEGKVPDQIRRGITKGVENFRVKAEKLVSGGADQIKLIASGAVLAYGSVPGNPEMSPEEIAAVVAVAKEANMNVTAHAHGALSIKQAIRSGVNSIEHASLIDEEGIQMAKEYGVALSMDIYNGDYINEVGIIDEWPEEFLRKNRETTDAQRENFTKAYKAGVKIIYGTDAGVYPHGDNAKQFKYMTKYGMTSIEAIQSATVDAAEVIGMSDQVGQVKIGFFADIIAVKKDPVLNIQALENIDVVIKGGKIYKQK